MIFQERRLNYKHVPRRGIHPIRMLTLHRGILGRFESFDKLQELWWYIRNQGVWEMISWDSISWIRMNRGFRAGRVIGGYRCLFGIIVGLGNGGYGIEVGNNGMRGVVWWSAGARVDLIEPSEINHGNHDGWGLISLHPIENYSPNYTQCNLRQWVNQRLERTFQSTPLFLCLNSRSSSQNLRPEINSMNILPIINSPESFLVLSSFPTRTAPDYRT